MAGRSHYPHGFLNGVNVRGTPVYQTHPGEVFWVNGGSVLAKDAVNGSDGNKGDYRHPFATIDYAIGKCTASRGDVIMVMPGHTETVTSSITADVIGISIIGLGSGAEMPTITGPAADECVDVTADDVTLQGLKFAAVTSGTQAATRKITLTGADCVVRDCNFQCGASDDNAIYVEVTADGAVIENNEFHVTANGPDVAIYLDGADGGDSLTQVTIRNNFFDGGSAANSWDEGVIYSSGVHTGCLVANNDFLYMSGGVGGVEFVAAATGLIKENFFGGGTLGQMLDPGSCYCSLNKEADAVDENSRTFPTSDAS